MNKSQRTSGNKKYEKQTEQKGKSSKRTRILIGAISGVIIIGAAVAFLVFKLNGNNVSIPSGYTISGTISYEGTQETGRVYIGLVDHSGAYSGQGTSVPSPRSYVIRNVPSGTYTLRAWMDNSQPETGVPNALSPTGNISVTVNNGDVSGQNIVIIDPSQTPAATAPSSVRIAPGNGALLVQWNSPQDANGNLLAEYYNVYYGTSDSITPETGIKKTVRANDSVFINGLADGSTYYFIVTSVLDGKESAPTSSVSATVGTTTGSNTVTGTISFSGQAKGPLYVGVAGQNGAFMQYIENPVSPQSYNISGIPQGNYVTFAVVDMNNNGVIDTGDLNKTNNAPSGGNTTVTVNQERTEVNQTLVSSNVLARVITLHYKSETTSDEVYSLEFEVGGNLKLPVHVVLDSEQKNAMQTTDISGMYNYYHLYVTANVTPKTGDSYIFTINYSDGTSEKVKVKISDVIQTFAHDLKVTGDDRTKPIFSWSPPDSPPPAYTYVIQIGQQNIGQEWVYPQNGTGMPSSQTSVSYNADGSASLTALQTGALYDWLIYVLDPDGNQAICHSTYTP